MAYEGVRRITLAAGPCALESARGTYDMAHKIALVRDALQPFMAEVCFRGGAWKPRTLMYNPDNGGERYFEGVGEEGLRWLSEVAVTTGMPVVTECMDGSDMKHFGQILEPDRDYVQIGARTSMAYALVYNTGATSFGVVLKNPMHGADPTEAMGSLQRLRHSRRVVYCLRGQHPFIMPTGMDEEAFRRLEAEIRQAPHQHPNARNYNNIESIRRLRESVHLSDNGLLWGYDPSHTFGGKNDLMRHMIGRYAIDAVKDFGYDWVIVEVNDRSASAICDGDQALLTTTNGVDWSRTNAGQRPGVRLDSGREPDIPPVTLVDIAGELIDYQAGGMGIAPEDIRVAEAKRKLDNIRWDMTA